MDSKNIENLKKKIKLTKEQREVIFGKMLGDGHLETQNKGRTYRLKIEHSIKQKEYVDWQFDLFRNIVLSTPQEKIKKINEISYVNYGFSTLSIDSFRFFANQFYKDNKKKIPKLIHRWLAPLTMAVWFMDDGSIKPDRNKSLILNTQSFSKKDVEMLKNVLEQKFGIKAKLRIQQRKQIGYQLYLLSETIDKFIDIVNPYILSSMRYKLGRLNNKLPKK